MKKRNRVGIGIMISVPAIILLYIVFIIALNSLMGYRPADTSLKACLSQPLSRLNPTDTFTVVSWNIGYGGLGKDADFFYDGGEMVHPSKAYYRHSFDMISNRIAGWHDNDFILLQEVDRSSRRSFFNDQHSAIKRLLTGHHELFVKNYDVPFVPVPLFRPLSEVNSGLSVFSRYMPAEAWQIVFPGNFEWPKRLFMPDRCFLALEYMLSTGSKLYLINTHNSAFDDGRLREQQLAVLWDFMLQCYNEGNYVLAGGDWNVNPPAYQADAFLSGDHPFRLGIKASIPDGWQVCFDKGYPTNRDVSAPYLHGHTPTTVIDYFICSPNVQVLHVKTQYDGFCCSDHHAVHLAFSLSK